MLNESIPYIGIIAAMKPEIDAIKSKIKDPEIMFISGIEFVYGEMYGNHVVAAISGIGKVFAAVCAQTMILEFNAKCIINVGVGGSLTPELKIGDAAIGVSSVQHDMNTTAVGDPRGLISGIDQVYFKCSEKCVKLLEDIAVDMGVNYKKGIIASGDLFLKEQSHRRSIIRNFNAIVCEMESASIGQVCFINEVDFAVLRTISDSGDENADQDYAVSLEKAAKVGIEMMLRFLEKFEF